MTVRADLLKLLTSNPEPGWSIVTLAQEVLRHAARSRALTLEVVACSDPSKAVFRITEGRYIIETSERTPFRLIRPLLACIANLQTDPFAPYGGSFEYEVKAPRGLARVTCEFVNARHEQRIAFQSKLRRAKKSTRPTRSRAGRTSR